MKENKTIKTIAIAVVSILIIAIIGLGIYTVFIKNDDNQGINNNQNNIVEKNYKTKDGKFSLRIIDQNDKKAYEAAKKESELYDGGYTADAGYAYLNNNLLILDDIKEDENYALYKALFPGRPGQYLEVFLVDKNKAQIIEQKNISDGNLSNSNEEIYYRFNGEGNLITFVKTDAGYFFAKVLDGPFTLDIVKIYTTSWKEIGYASLDNIQSDAKGIYVYKNFDSNFNLNGSTFKYDINGNKIN